MSLTYKREAFDRLYKATQRWQEFLFKGLETVRSFVEFRNCVYAILTKEFGSQVDLPGDSVLVEWLAVAGERYAALNNVKQVLMASAHHRPRSLNAASGSNPPVTRTLNPATETKKLSVAPESVPVTLADGTLHASETASHQDIPLAAEVNHPSSAPPPNAKPTPRTNGPPSHYRGRGLQQQQLLLQQYNQQVLSMNGIDPHSAHASRLFANHVAVHGINPALLIGNRRKNVPSYSKHANNTTSAVSTESSTEHTKETATVNRKDSGTELDTHPTDSQESTKSPSSPSQVAPTNLSSSSIPTPTKKIFPRPASPPLFLLDPEIQDMFDRVITHTRDMQDVCMNELDVNCCRRVNAIQMHLDQWEMELEQANFATTD